MDAAALHASALDLRDVLLAGPELQAATTVAAYVSVGSEPGTGPLLDELRDRGVQVLLPVLLPDDDLDWAPYDGPDRLVGTDNGLREPTTAPLGPDAVLDADVIVAPALAVDRHGLRLGRGRGCYDRALARLAGHSWTCVLLHEGELLDLPVPREPHDMPVSAAATPLGLHRFSDSVGLPRSGS